MIKLNRFLIENENKKDPLLEEVLPMSNKYREEKWEASFYIFVTGDVTNTFNFIYLFKIF